MVYEFSQDFSNDPPFDQLDQALLDAENSNRETFEELDRRVKAEKNALNAVMRQVMSPFLISSFLLFCR